MLSRFLWPLKSILKSDLIPYVSIAEK